MEKNLKYIQIDFRKNIPAEILQVLFEQKIQSVIIEGGVTILNHFVNAGIWDEARVFSSNVIWKEGLQAPKINGEIIENLLLGNDQLTIYKPFSN